MMKTFKLTITVDIEADDITSAMGNFFMTTEDTDQTWNWNVLDIRELTNEEK